MLLVFKIIIVILILFFCLVVYYFIQERKITDARTKINSLKINKNINDEIFKNNIPKYYINLERYTDREKHIQKEFSEYGIKNYKKIKAFDGKNIINIKEGTIDNIKYVNRGACTKYELAITLSHLKAIKTAHDDKCEYAIIMEDDIEFTLLPYCGKNISDVIKELPSDCDIFLLANRSEYVNKHKYNIVKITGDCTGVCYLVTKRGIENIINKYIHDDEYILKQKNITLDCGIMLKFNVYSYDQTFFVLENFKNISTHYNYLDYIFGLNYTDETNRLLNKYISDK